MISQSPAPAPNRSDFRYDFSLEAAEHNSAILAAHNYDLAAAISSQGFTELTMGSEIRPIAQLDRLLRHHPHYEEARKLLLEGVDYPAADLPEETRRARLESQLRKGNQASALTQEALPIITKLMIDDIVKGYALIVTIDCIKRLKDAEVYPMGLQHQLTVNEKGETIPKKRLTQNLSADRKSGLSINQRISLEDLPPTKYGWALLRYVHLIHHIRYRNPGRRILCNKIDIDKAYRRIHTTPTVSAKCCATWKLHEINDATGEISKESDVDIATIMNRLPFGSRPAPAYFSQISEITFDLANDLIRCQLWDPSTTPPPLQHELPAPQRLPNDAAFGIALEADVEFEENVDGGCEGYIDDSATAVLDTPENAQMVERTRNCNMMALHLTFRPNAGEREPIPRPHEASIRKLLAEGGLKELIIFLGWLINTRAFTIALPKEKASAWIRSIVEVINKPSAQWQELATLVGRLNHACYVIPSARHFINRIRRAQELADKYRSIRIDDETKRDLLLWIDLLRKASGGISINNIVYRKPTCIPITDASEIGIGGYCLNSNKLWRYQFNTYEQRSFTLNAKEYIASVVGAIIALEDDSSSHPCVASLSDSTSTVAWLHKSNHDPNSHPIHNAIARWHARNLLAANACDYSQHVPGSENYVADSLSRDHHLTDTKLLSLLQTTVPHLLPPNPQIITLSDQIISKIAGLAHLEPKKRELNWRLTPSTLAAGVTGWNSSPSKPNSAPTPTWTGTPPSIEPVSYAPSWMTCAAGSSPNRIPLRGIPRSRPSIMWHRPSSQVIGQTPASPNPDRSTS